MTPPEPLKPFQSNRSKGRIKHGHTSRELLPGKETGTYQSWRAMRVRCRLAGRCNSDRYKDAGITRDPRWDSFAAFLEDMGERPLGTSLDRWPDMRGNYEPGNCRWATAREQARNTIRTKLTFEKAVEIATRRLNGEPSATIARDYGVSANTPREIGKGRAWPDALAQAIAAWNRRAEEGRE
ncbi:hypothetical protein [Rhodovarius lipocyclicus]|uniref:hypothetical protein n=1 Tax=Rhodovarius lipocyclicus TaxID=268410 RepID=UPI0013585B32|nr:hypothetical protein [Rhodovarius lipocyclicus]